MWTRLQRACFFSHITHVHGACDGLHDCARHVMAPDQLQDNDVERETQMNREYVDYTTEESWRWAIACEPRFSVCCHEAEHGDRPSAPLACVHTSTRCPTRWLVCSRILAYLQS
jgi:hypothetical protein